MSGHSEDNSLRAVLVAVSANTLIMVAKYVGWFFTRSPAMLAEAIHTTADVGNQILLWVGVRKSQRAATPEHPYGWGAARYMWNLKSAMGIFFLGAGVTVYHGLHALHEGLTHAAPVDASWWGIGILLFSLALETFSLTVALHGINKDRGETPLWEYMTTGDDPTGIGVLLEDGAAVLGVVLALVGIGLSQALGNPLPDAIATLIIGAGMGWVAWFLARSNGRLLIGAAVSPALAKKIQAALEADEIVQRVDDLKTEIIGQGKIRVKCEVDLHEKLIAKYMREALEKDVKAIKDGAEPMKVMVGVVGRAVRITGNEIRRLEGIVSSVAPQAVHIDLELI